MLFTPARPFRTFQNKAWVSSNCAQCPAAPREPGSCLHLCQRHPPTAVTNSCNSTWAWDLFRRSLKGYFYSKVRSSGRSVCQERVLLERIVKVMIMTMCEWWFQGDVWSRVLAFVSHCCHMSLWPAAEFEVYPKSWVLCLFCDKLARTKMVL